MMRAPLLALAIMSACQVAVGAAPPAMTGERLVKLLGNVDRRTVHWTRESPFPSPAVAAQFRDIANGEFVQGYISAVMDATEGKEWCWSPYQPKPHILLDATTRTLQAMSGAQLKRNAAELIVENWRAKFPCGERRTK